MVAWILLVIGGLNWLLVGIGGFAGGNWNVVNLILGAWPAVEWLVYILVGLSAVYELVSHKQSSIIYRHRPTSPSLKLLSVMLITEDRKDRRPKEGGFFIWSRFTLP